MRHGAAGRWSCPTTARPMPSRLLSASNGSKDARVSVEDDSRSRPCSHCRLQRRADRAVVDRRTGRTSAGNGHRRVARARSHHRREWRGDRRSRGAWAGAATGSGRARVPLRGDLWRQRHVVWRFSRHVGQPRRRADDRPPLSDRFVQRQLELRDRGLAGGHDDERTRPRHGPTLARVDATAATAFGCRTGLRSRAALRRSRDPRGGWRRGRCLRDRALVPAR